MSERIENLLEFVEEPHHAECLAFIKNNERLFNSSKGSATKHQPWPGGYRDHITEVMHIAMVTYHALERIRPLPFTLSDALFGCFLHDVEKIWKHVLDPQDKQEVDKIKVLRENFTLNADHWNAIKYSHGEGDDYHPTDRIQLPLAAFVHHCDNTSARIWFDKPGPHDRSVTVLEPRYRDSTGNEWDLNDPSTYTSDKSWFPKEHLDLDARGLRKEVELRIAHSLYYMDCWNPGWGDGGQHKRVLEFGRSFAREIRREERRDSVLWLRKQLFLILDECENQC